MIKDRARPGGLVPETRQFNPYVRVLGLSDDAPGIKKGVDGKPIISAEVFLSIPKIRKSDGSIIYGGLRGVGLDFFVIHPEVRLISGRTFLPGRRELVVGVNSQKQFLHFDLGDRVLLPAGEWTVAGIFDSSGDQLASQALADADTVMSAAHLTAFNSVWAQLQRPDPYGPV